MSILHVRNVPEDLYKQIKKQAAAQNRSISAEVITLLQRAVTLTGQGQAEVMENVRRRRFFSPADAGAPDSTTLLREDRKR